MEFKELLGKVFTEIKVNDYKNEILFKTETEQFKMYHDQDCCEGVEIEDINGDLADLLNTPILKADEVIHENENPSGVEQKEYQDSFTWTFYKLATIKGYVDIRWYGESNGYYSESVDLSKVDKDGKFSRW